MKLGFNNQKVTRNALKIKYQYLYLLLHLFLEKKPRDRADILLANKLYFKNKISSFQNDNLCFLLLIILDVEGKPTNQPKDLSVQCFLKIMYILNIW